MSLVVCVYVPTGMVLSADSRTTGTTSQTVADPSSPDAQLVVQTNVVLSDAANKLFLLFERYGVETYGDANANDLPIAHYIEQNEAGYAETPPATTHDCSEGLLAHFNSLDPKPNIGLVVAGYDNLVPNLESLDLNNNSIVRFNVDDNDQVQYGILRAGDTAVVDRLLSQPEFNPSFNVMQLQDAVDYSRHLTRSTIDQLRFEPRFATVGGPIDTLVVQPTGARWLARKELQCS